MKDKKLSNSVNITVNDIQDATCLILNHVQQELFRNEYLNLLQRKPIKIENLFSYSQF